MKTILAFLLFAVMAPVMAFATEASNQYGTLPGSDQSTPVVAAAATPAAVAISSTSPTRIDTAVNTALLAALGGNYKRAKIDVQVLDGAKVNCGYTNAVTTQPAGGFQYVANADPKEHKIGKAMGIWCQGIVSTATFIVGGLGFK